MVEAPDSSEARQSKRVPKPRTVFQGGDEPTLLLDPASAPTKSDKKRAFNAPKIAQLQLLGPSKSTKRKRQEAEVVELIENESQQPAKKSATRAKSVKKEGSVARETAKSSDKDPKRSAAMKAAWAKRQAEGKNGRRGGAPLASTVAKGNAKKGWE